MILDEVQLARVPNQLVSDESQDSEGESNEDATEKVQEFSGAASGAGYMLPLGAKAPNVSHTHFSGNKKNRKKK